MMLWPIFRAELSRDCALLTYICNIFASMLFAGFALKMPRRIATWREYESERCRTIRDVLMREVIEVATVH